MTISIVTNLFVCLGLATQPALSPAIADARAGDSTGRFPRPVPVVAPTALLEPAVSPAAVSSFELRRNEIFAALRGGDPALEVAVAAHLWNLAGRLAASEWSPPRMNVEVVVSGATPRK